MREFSFGQRYPNQFHGSLSRAKTFLSKRGVWKQKAMWIESIKLVGPERWKAEKE